MSSKTEGSSAAKFKDAEVRFQALVTQLESHDQDGGQVVTTDAVTDALDRFKLWAGNIGAVHTADSKLSLEFRLAAAPELLEQVSDLLDDLIEALDDLQEIVSGNRHNRQIPDNPVEGEEPSSISGVADDSFPTVGAKDEAHDILDVVSECIRGLLKISILIRKATPRDRFAKALRKRQDPYLDEFDIRYVEERHPKLRRPNAQWLSERFGRAITKRREFLRYCREHRDKMAGKVQTNYVTPEYPSQPKEEKKKGLENIAPGTLAPSVANTKHDGAKTVWTKPSTKASTLNVAQLAVLQETQDHDNRSYISAASSVRLGSEEATLHLPSLRDVSKGNAAFECPLCCGIQSISREYSWKRHAYQDLKAYVCTLGEGECDFKLFGDSKAWFNHELQCHRRQWTCIVCRKGPFRDQERFHSHVKQAHPDLEVNQWTVLLHAGQRPLDAIPAGDCPFCDEWEQSLRAAAKNQGTADNSLRESAESTIVVDPPEFRRHVAFHMEQLALFAIPRDTGDDEDDGNLSKAAIRSNATARNSQTFERQAPSEGGEGWQPDPPLHIAAAGGDLLEVQRLLDEGADVHSKGETWGTALEAASSTGLSNIAVWELLSRYAKADPLREAHNPALEIKPASSPRDWSQLGKPSVQPSAQPKVDTASGLGSQSNVGKGPNLNQMPLSWAAETGNEVAVQVLLGGDADFESKNEYDQTPLSLAARNGYEVVVRQFLEKGADFESKDTYGKTPLSWAAENGQEAVVRLLLEKGADLESKHEYGRTALSWAAKNGQEAVVRLLLEKGADLESKDQYDRTPLSWAAENGQEAVVRLLLEKGADLESKHEYGRTPLLWAAKNGHEAVVRLLLKKGADLTLETSTGRTLLSWAAENGHEAVVQLLQPKI
ncbi:hypothetical protein DL764_004780 [Monosporascus ibericus]|uniref:Oxidoreductase acuF-like C2H2 type zinc-finger domain-containing protein n=1 Tax=Monosporascus ibericus TaxID=155417 RepID=A0A4Q4TBD7_9PEZI|nr:hypothetical protein DL764_004780 [Monosporascus ibericus]